MRTIALPERGWKEVADADWADIAASPEFRKLVSANVLSARVSRGASGWEIGAGCFVGRSIVGDIAVEVHEKVPGAFNALARAAAPEAFKACEVSSPLAPGEASEVVLMRMFLASVRTYLSGFKQVVYGSSVQTGAILSGRLDVVRTARLQASGQRHRAAFFRSELTDDVPLNRAIYTALGDVLACGLHLLQKSDIATARVLRSSFDAFFGMRNEAIRADLLSAALAEGQASAQREVREAASLTAMILDAASITTHGASRHQSPRSWFLNLENLFEKALRKTVAELLGNRCVVSGPDNRPPLFPSKADRFRSNPDIVIRSSAGILIADAKYKFDELSAEPPLSTGDVHEILAHAAAFGAERSLLFYPRDGALTAQALGRSATGCSLWAFAVPFHGFRKAVSQALTIVGLVVP